jgi:hypothetical protein
VILGSSSEKGDTSNIDLLNSAGEGTVGLLSLENERVEIADDKSDGRDVVGGQVGEVRVDLSRKNTWILARAGIDRPTIWTHLREQQGGES